MTDELQLPSDQNEALTLAEQDAEVIDWPQHKQLLQKYHRQIVAAMARADLPQDAQQGVDLAAAHVAIGVRATIKEAIEQGETPEDVAMWAAIRMCHDLSVHTSQTAAHDTSDAATLGVMTVMSMLLGRLGHGLVARVKSTSART